MRYSLISIAILAIAALGCGKDNAPVTPYYPDDYGAFTYEIEGMNDTTVERLGSTAMFAYVKKKSGPTEDVTFAAENLPQGITVSFEPATAKPPFNIYLKIKADKLAEGTYPITILSTSKTTGAKRKTVKVTVIPYGNEALAVSGPFKETHQCTQSGEAGFNVFLEPATTANNRVNIKGFWSSSWTNVVYADLNASAKTLIIPTQKTNGMEFKGGGVYDENKLTINYTVTDTLGGQIVNESCTATIQRQ